MCKMLADATCTSDFDCCGALLCHPSPTTQRCCVGVSGNCPGGATDCCGYMLCDATAHTCTCQGDQASCIYDGECCAGLVCISSKCQSPAGGCKAVQDTTCTVDTDCCGALLCKPSPSTTQCCAPSGESCPGGSGDCCGQMLCLGGTCQCRKNGETCVYSGECCDVLVCDGTNHCAAAAGGSCKSAGDTTCTSDLDCCGTLLCKPSPSQIQCCTPSGQTCASASDCCGYMLCDMTAHTCACQMPNQSCVYDGECCNGTCSTTTHTCN